MKKYVWKKVWTRKYAPFIIGPFMRSFLKGSKSNTAPNKLFVPDGRLHAMYFEQSELDRLTAKYVAFLRKQDLKTYAPRYENILRRFLIWSERMSKKGFAHLSNQRLASLALDLYDKMVPFMEAQFFAFLVLEGPVPEVEKRLADEPSILRSISTTYRHTQIVKARLELLRLVKAKRTDEADLNKYVRKYAWLTVYDFIDAPLSLADLKEQVAAIKDAGSELGDIARHQKEGLREYHKYYRSLRDQDWKKLVEIVHYFSYLKEVRDDYRRHAYYLWRPFWQEVAERLQCSLEEANFLIAEELAKALTTKKDYHPLIQERQRGYAQWLREGKLRIYAGEDVKKITALVQEEFQTDIRGFCASRGKVTAKANVVYHRDEFEKFAEGDVLVTTMTHPEFLLVMKKASAIVTDEGGITCHAAIVSRELGKPCIIGTKVATKVLKDGDLIEVDANVGTVKIVKCKS